MYDCCLNPPPPPGSTPTLDAVRRFFYVDGSIGSNAANGIEVVQYPLSMQLVMTNMQDPRDQMFPPQLSIT